MYVGTFIHMLCCAKGRLPVIQLELDFYLVQIELDFCPLFIYVIKIECMYMVIKRLVMVLSAMVIKKNNPQPQQIDAVSEGIFI